ncbi:MAG: DUF2384 domain-containing protein [Luteitalea sp.]|nr:DUF2384 domain-containing protein [Luteitalea sp.]
MSITLPSAGKPAAEPAAVLAKAVLSAAARLGLRNRHLAVVLGTSEATVSRLQRGRGIDPSSKEGEVALLFLRMYRSLDSLMGGDDAQARKWLHAKNDHLAGVPAARIQRLEGLMHVLRYLDAMRGRL